MKEFTFEEIEHSFNKSREYSKRKKRFRRQKNIVGLILIGICLVPSIIITFTLYYFDII